MNWQFVLKAKPSANTILVEIITAFDELYNKIKVADIKSKATGSNIFKNLFKENPDLDTNFETVKKVYEEKMLSQMLSPELIDENELLKRFSMIKELVTQKAKRTDYNEEFFQKLFSSKKNPANIKELLVIYQKKIADSVPQQSRSRYITGNQENTARIQSLYKKNQEKPTVEQFRKNEVPNFDYVLVKVIVEGKEKPKKTGWTADGNALFKVFEEDSDKIESEVAKIDNVSETKVIFSPIRKNFGEKTSLEIETTAKNYNAVEINQENLANYLNTFRNMQSMTDIKLLDREVFTASAGKVKSKALFGGQKLTSVPKLIENILLLDSVSLLSRYIHPQLKSRRQYGQFFLHGKNIPEKEQDAILTEFVKQYTILEKEVKEGRRKSTDLLVEDFEGEISENIVVSESNRTLYNDFKDGYKRLLQNIQNNEIDETFNRAIEDSKTIFTTALDSILGKDEEDEYEGVSNPSSITKEVMKLSKSTEESINILLKIIPMLRQGVDGNRDFYDKFDDFYTELEEDFESVDDEEYEADFKKIFYEAHQVFKDAFIKSANEIMQGIAKKEDEKYFSLANNSKFISKLVENKLLEEA